MIILCIKCRTAAVLFKVSAKLKNTVCYIVVALAVTPVTVGIKVSFYMEIVVCVIHFDNAVRIAVFNNVIFLICY